MKYLLTFTDSQYPILTESDDPSVEHLTYAYASLSKYQNTNEFIVREVRTIKPSEYLVRAPGFVQVSHDTTWEVLKPAGKGYSALISAHSHTCDAFFSGTDNEQDYRFFHNAHHFCPYFIRMVKGVDGIVAQVFCQGEDRPRAIHLVKVVGPSGIQWFRPKNSLRFRRRKK